MLWFRTYITYLSIHLERKGTTQKAWPVQGTTLTQNNYEIKTGLMITFALQTTKYKHKKLHYSNIR